PMVAHSSVSPHSWRPTTRTLGALFAGSAVTLSATLMHGSPLVLTGDDAGPSAGLSPGGGVVAPEQTPSASTATSLAGPGQAAPWSPGAIPQWGSSLKDLPVRRAPVHEATHQAVPAATASSPATSASSAHSAAPAPSRAVPHEGARPADAGFGGAPRKSDPQGGSFGGLLNNVIHVTQGISR
ncbi:MAG: hypothetical protein ACRDSH_11335, partial [Pseudonocardiaceae bacterium]